MQTKIILKDIPAGKFHSAVLTTYSIDLYFFEQQVLPLLGSKGVHYVSVLADGGMLSKQLSGYSGLSERRWRNYALHGMQSNGAFHPKIIFLAGDRSLLLLIGSGNLTSAGHGKNLETWNAVYVDAPTDLRLGLLKEAWSFIQHLHQDLGKSALHKINTIAENCDLLRNTNQSESQQKYANGGNGALISFLGSQGIQSMFEQLKDAVGEQSVNQIHLMCPYYDVNGAFLHQLEETFRPNKINVILQEEFGMIPYKMKPLPNVRFYTWTGSQKRDFKQSFFHAKHIIFEGSQTNLMYTGSANASMAAFGGPGFREINTEAGLIYEKSNFDFFSHLEIELRNDIQLVDLSIPALAKPITGEAILVYIKTAEKQRNEVHFSFFSKQALTNVEVVLYGASGNLMTAPVQHIPAGESTWGFTTKETDLIYAEVCYNDAGISNKQFIVNFDLFESTNPSPQNRSLNQIRKLVEGGSFSSQKIIEYLSTIYQQRLPKQQPATSLASSDTSNNNWFQENEELMYLSYNEIQDRIKLIARNEVVKINTSYKTVKLWDSIFAYLKEAKRSHEENAIDEEETEDISNSTGRLVNHKPTNRKPVSVSDYDKLKKKVTDFLYEYLDILQAKINNPNAGQPSLIDLSMFLIVMEILLHLFSHKEKVKQDEQEIEQSLLRITFSDTENSWSDFLLRVIGTFSLWVLQKGGLEITGDPEYTSKMRSYIEMAEKTAVAGLAIFSLINTTYEAAKINIWTILGLRNVKLCFPLQKDGTLSSEDHLFFIPQEIKNELGEANLKDEVERCLMSTMENLDEAHWYEHPEDGITFIARKIPDVGELKFLKLIHIGYDWDESTRNYWNARVFSLLDWRWRKAM